MACGSLLELELLNTEMGGQGIFVGNELRFYTRVLLYAVTFGPYGSFNVERFNRYLGYWEDVEFGGTLKNTVDILNLFGPYLSSSDVDTIWADVKIPPETPNSGVLLDPV